VAQKTSSSGCQTPSGQIQGDQREQGIDDYEGKNFEKKKVLRWEWRRHPMISKLT